ncbi:MAG: CBS domain-containing protein [Methanobacteriota archaeon]
MKVRELMTRDPIVAEVPGTRNDVVRLLVHHAVSGLPVVKAGGKKLAGIVTRSDIFRRPDEEQLALVMTKNPVTVKPGDDVTKAARLFFEHKIHGLPVVEDGELVGVISPTDVLRVIAEKNGGPTQEYVTDKVCPVHESTPLKVAWEIMNLARQNALPVLDDDAVLVGIVADSDLFKKSHVDEKTRKSAGVDSGSNEEVEAAFRGLLPLFFANSRVDLPQAIVKEIMSTSVVTVFQKTKIGEAARKMTKHRVNQLPVINSEDRLVGMITDLDLMQAEI